MPDNEEITKLTPQHKLFILGEEPLEPDLLGRHTVQVDAGQTWLLYRDGQLVDRLKPGRHTWWNGFRHKWRIQKINERVELLPIPVSGRVKGPGVKDAGGGSAVNLACDVKALLQISCRIAQIDNFLQYRDPLSTFIASIQNLVVEFIGRLSYDQYGQWATEIRDATKRRLQFGGSDDAERRLGIRVEEIFVTAFEPNTAHDRNVLQMYQLVERSKREMVEAQANASRDAEVARSYANQGQILNIAPSILALQNSPIGKSLIDRDADLQRLLVASGLNPGVTVQPLQDAPGQLSSGQASAIGYLKPPRTSPPEQAGPRSVGGNQVTGQIFPLDSPGNVQSQSQPFMSAPSLPEDRTNPPVDEGRQQMEISNLEKAGFQVAGRGQVVPVYDEFGQPVAGSREWVLQIYVKRFTGYLEIVCHCPSGYPAFPPAVEVKPPTGGGRQWVTPNTVHEWNPGYTLVDVAREIAENIP